jgi:hypothetical protein
MRRGKYNDLSSQTFDVACELCAGEYFCPTASTSPLQQVCFDGDPTIATTYFCPKGTLASETNGGQTIIIEGTNFGPVGGAGVTAQ